MIVGWKLLIMLIIVLSTIRMIYKYQFEWFETVMLGVLTTYSVLYQIEIAMKKIQGNIDKGKNK